MENKNEVIKKADNRILNVETKQKINIIDSKLDAEKKKLRQLSNMQDNVESIAKHLDRCIELLSKSIKGPTTNVTFSDMRTSNETFLTKTSTTIEYETMMARKKINELYKEKDDVLRENRERYNRQREQEEKEIREKYKLELEKMEKENKENYNQEIEQNDNEIMAEEDNNQLHNQNNNLEE